MLRRTLALVGAAVTLALGGCAHPIAIQPNLGVLAGSGVSKIDKKVGLVVTDEDRKLQVTTPGGGGDKVEYFPYRDLETGLYMALSEVFTSVARVNGPADPKVQAEQLSYLLTPRLVTQSSSESALTWPPTRFSIELTCKVVDGSGKELAQLQVVGDGQATYDEFKKDFSLSANRAGEDLLKKLVKALAETPALR